MLKVCRKLSRPATAPSAILYLTTSGNNSRQCGALGANGHPTPEDIHHDRRPRLALHRRRLGAAVDLGAHTVLNAATEEVLGTVPDADIADVDGAVAAARNAVENSEWSQASPADAPPR